METLEELLWNNFPIGKPIQASRVFGFIHGVLDDQISKVFSGSAEEAIVSYLERLSKMGYITYLQDFFGPDMVTFHPIDPSNVSFFSGPLDFSRG